VRDLVCGELGLDGQSGGFGEYPITVSGGAASI